MIKYFFSARLPVSHALSLLVVLLLFILQKRDLAEAIRHKGMELK
jgi:hypothetical protein